MPVTPAMAGQDSDARALAEVMQKATPFAELGVTGLKHSAGYIDEEFLPQLKGRKAVQVYREMGENDPIVGALLFAITQLLRNVDWKVTPAGKTKEHADAAKLVETSMEDMSHTWDDFIVEVCSMLQYGWAWHETVYKRRLGPWEKDGRRRSKYTDGLVGWRRLPIRAQETLQRWVIDDDGGVRGMVQLAPPDYKTRLLPIERGILFRHGAHKGNPEGRSLLRNAYRPWFYKKRLEEFESVGVERDLAGLPMVEVPADYLRARPGTDQHKMVDSFKKMVRSVRRNEQEGLVFPTSYDPDTKQPNFRFSLLGSGGARQFSTNELITRYEQRILMTVLADWIMVGHTQTGTYNLHVDKTGVFRTALNAVAQNIAETINRHAVPKLFAANGWKPAELPRIQPSNVDAPDLMQLAGFLSQTAGLGFTWGPDADLERYLRHAAGLPELADDSYNRKRTVARRTEATQMAEVQTSYLAARSALAEAMAQEEMTRLGEMTPEQAAAVQQQQMAGQQQQAAQQQADVQNARDAETHELQMSSGRLDQVERLSSMLGGGAERPQNRQGRR